MAMLMLDRLFVEEVRHFIGNIFLICRMRNDLQLFLLLLRFRILLFAHFTRPPQSRRDSFFCRSAPPLSGSLATKAWYIKLNDIAKEDLQQVMARVMSIPANISE
jgi:hypothetical protein